jgi:hypothetical protein
MLLKGAGGAGLAPSFLQLGLNSEEGDDKNTANHQPSIIDNCIFVILIFEVVL